MNTFALRKLINKLKPDILHAHYASGYGTLARLVKFEPYLLSVWGSDVFIFPNKSLFNSFLIKKNIKAANYLASTSISMKDQVEKICRNDISEITITPFGVDCENFKPLIGDKKNNKFTVGTVKSLESIYGIDLLIKAFSVFAAETNVESELIIVGEGEKKDELKKMTRELGIEENVKFIGKVDNDEVPVWLNRFDVFVALSNFESFGVAVIEASACGIPVIVTQVGGLPEVVVNENTGFVVPKGDYKLASEKMKFLFENPSIMKKMGENGRAFVLNNYEWCKTADVVEDLYKRIETNSIVTKTKY